MQKLKGLGVSHGISIGKAVLKEIHPMTIPERRIEKECILRELERLDSAIEKVVSDIDHLIDEYAFSDVDREILHSHKLILQDPELRKNVSRILDENMVGLENAVHRHFSYAIDLFEKMDNAYYAERVSDYREVANRLLGHMMGYEDDILSKLHNDSILVLEEIPVSLLTKVSKKGIAGVVAEIGSRTSHSSIVARALGIPAVVGVENLLKSVSNDQELILDGYAGEVILSPSQQNITLYKHMIEQERYRSEQLLKLVDLPAKTKDGVRINLRCNIELPDELAHVKRINADGIGLFRTEFIYIGDMELPSENEQFEQYKMIAEALKPNPVIIRTVDIGGDKLHASINLRHEENPNLGCRGIRLSLRNPEMFHAQLKAILRASHYGNIKVMFPMVSSLDELLRAKQHMNECMNELRKNEIPFDEEIKLGVMIEVPSAAMISDTLAQHCDFFSIGTNDLIQYTLAVDRTSENVTDYYNPYHPAIMHLITLIVQNARKYNLPVSVCGEMASDRDFVPILLGLGITELSVNPGSLLIIKEFISKIDSSILVDLVLDILDQITSKNVQKTIVRWRDKYGIKV